MKIHVYAPDAHKQRGPNADDSILARTIKIDGAEIQVQIYGRGPTTHLIAVARTLDLMPLLCAFPSAPEE